MSTTIRLARFGKKFAPSYKIVVANTRDKRNGKFIEILGYYNPSENPVKFKLDKDKVEEWTKKGALLTKAVSDLIGGSYEHKPYAGSTLEKASKSKSETKTETVEAEVPATATKTEENTESPEETPKEKVESEQTAE